MLAFIPTERMFRKYSVWHRTLLNPPATLCSRRYHTSPVAVGCCGCCSPAREPQPSRADRCLNDNFLEPCQVHFQITIPCIFRCGYCFNKTTNTIPQKQRFFTSSLFQTRALKENFLPALIIIS